MFMTVNKTTCADFYSFVPRFNYLSRILSLKLDYYQQKTGTR